MHWDALDPLRCMQWEALICYCIHLVYWYTERPGASSLGFVYHELERQSFIRNIVHNSVVTELQKIVACCYSISVYVDWSIRTHIHTCVWWSATMISYESRKSSVCRFKAINTFLIGRWQAPQPAIFLRDFLGQARIYVFTPLCGFIIQ